MFAEAATSSLVEVFAKVFGFSKSGSSSVFLVELKPRFHPCFVHKLWFYPHFFSFCDFTAIFLK